MILAVVEPSFESMALAERIVYMAEGMGISRAGALLNKVTSKAMEEKMILELKKRRVQTLGTVFFDSAVQEAGFEGRPPGETSAKLDMEPITQMLLNILQSQGV
jgi:CO dehydrogenase nickel-insertion accessory protein CooC1